MMIHELKLVAIHLFIDDL